MNCENVLKTTKRHTKARDSQHHVFKPQWEGLNHLQRQLIIQAQASQLLLPRFVVLGQMLAFWTQRKFHHFPLTLGLTFCKMHAWDSGTKDSEPNTSPDCSSQPRVSNLTTDRAKKESASYRTQAEMSPTLRLQSTQALQTDSKRILNAYHVLGNVIKKGTDLQSSRDAECILSAHLIFPYPQWGRHF